MEQFPSQSHKSTEGPREIQPITRNPGRVRNAPFGRRLLDTFVLGDLKTTLNNMIWDTFFPNMRENFQDSLHNGVESLFGGVSSGWRGQRNSSRYSPSSQISRHNPDRALSGRGAAPEPRLSREDRQAQRLSVIELDSRAEAEDVLNAMNATIDQYDMITLADFYQMVRIDPEHTDFGWGWEDLGGAAIVHSRGAYYLDLPRPISLRK